MSATQPKKIGLWRTTSLVTGNMIASGIFMLPAALAAYGSISLIGWVLSGFGAIVLAIVYARLSQIYPGATGGPYAYTRQAMGDFAAFLVAWSYWISLWTTNAAIAIAFVSYLGVFFPVVSSGAVPTAFTAIAATWLLTLINTRGITTAGSVQLITTVLKLIPLIVIAAGGLFYIQPENFYAFNVSGGSVTAAVTATATLTLFAFQGLECATIPAGSVEHPERTVPRATIIGTLLVTVLYFLSTVSVMGIIPVQDLQQSSAPFADAARSVWGNWAGYLVAGGAVISTFGALNGWILMQGQMPAAAAADKLLPSVFARQNKSQVPTVSLVGSSVLITILLLMNTSLRLADTFQFIILISTMAVLIAYLLSMASYMIIAARTMERPDKRNLHITLALIGFAYSLWALAGAGMESVYYGLLAVVAGIPLYAWRKMKFDRI